MTLFSIRPLWLACRRKSPSTEAQHVIARLTEESESYPPSHIEARVSPEMSPLVTRIS
jgi:hypothetical protein